MNDLVLFPSLPRSGSTLLSSILNQHPQLYVTQTSNFVEVLWKNYSCWESDTPESNVSYFTNIKDDYLKQITNLYFSYYTDKNIIVDKSRYWFNLNNLHMYHMVYGKYPKIICTVRDRDEIINSFKNISQKSHITFNGHHQRNLIDKFYNEYEQIKKTHFKECFHYIEYNSIVDDTDSVMKQLCKYLDISDFKFDYNNIESNLEVELDNKIGFKNLHYVRNEIKRREYD